MKKSKFTESQIVKALKPGRSSGKLTILFLQSIIFLFSCMPCKKISIDENKLFEIHFQGGFQGDKTELFINNCRVFDNISLVSDSNDERANLTIKVYRGNTKSQIIFFEQRISCSKFSEPIKLSLIINNSKDSFLVNTQDFPYVGFYKNVTGKINIRMSKIPFVYN